MTFPFSWPHRAALAFAALGCLAAGSASALEVKLPAETATLKDSSLPGAQGARSYCMTCHSVDYISQQPSKDHAFWLAEVNKMVKVYGAQIPADQIPAIAEYLSKTYGTEGQAK